MAVNLWSPGGDCHIGLTSGHTFIVPGDKAGVEVPQKFRREAIARGCVPVDVEPEQPNTFERATVIRGGAKRSVAHARARDDPPHQQAAHDTSAADPEAAARPETDEAAAAAHAVSASLGDRVVGKIWRALQRAGDVGLTKTSLRDLFGRNLPAGRIRDSLELLQRQGMARCETASTASTSGRPPEVWKATK